MKTTKFAPKERMAQFIDGLNFRLSEAGLTAKIYEKAGNVQIDGVLLKASMPHTAPYDQHYNPNWQVEIDRTSKTGLIARHVRKPYITSPVRMSKHLNWDDWTRFNTIFNKVADEMGIFCNLKTGVATIRNGRQWGAW